MAPIRSSLVSPGPPHAVVVMNVVLELMCTLGDHLQLAGKAEQDYHARKTRGYGFGH